MNPDYEAFYRSQQLAGTPPLAIPIMWQALQTATHGRAALQPIDIDVRQIPQQTAPAPIVQPTMQQIADYAQKAAYNPKKIRDFVMPWDNIYRQRTIAAMAMLPSDVVLSAIDIISDLTDWSAVSASDVTGARTAKFFFNGETQGNGVTNVTNGQLDQNFFFHVYAMQLSYAEAPTIGEAKFGQLTNDAAPITNGVNIKPAILNGKFSWVNNRDQKIESSSASIFNQYNQTLGYIGFYEMNNPKWVFPLTNFKFDFEFAAEVNPVVITDKCFLKLDLYGNLLYYKGK